MFVLSLGKWFGHFATRRKEEAAQRERRVLKELAPNRSSVGIKMAKFEQTFSLTRLRESKGRDHPEAEVACTSLNSSDSKKKTVDDQKEGQEESEYEYEEEDEVGLFLNSFESSSSERI